MADTKPQSKKSLQALFAELGDKKLIIVGPGNMKLQDSRFAVQEVGLDHVIIKLLGEEQLVIPFSSITSLKLERQQVTVTYR